MSKRDVAVIVVAAGKGERLGKSAPKAFVEVNGKSLLAHTLGFIAPLTELEQLIVAVPEGFEAETRSLAEQALQESGHPEGVRLDVVVGGATRQASISNALKALDPDIEVVLIHDAARTFQPTEVFNRVISKVRETGNCVIPADSVVDTIKRISESRVLETVDRNTLIKAQTPQGFLTSGILAAYESATKDHTDDASLWQEFGGIVEFVAGDPRGLKITTPDDLIVVKDSDEQDTLAGVRTGIGTDTHRFSDNPEKKLYLGTVVWEGEPGLEGHSDGDAVSHAIVDALLSAAGLGDIGSRFGVDRPEFAGANGEVFLRGTRDLLAEAGFEIGNVSVQIIGNRPKVAPHRARVEQALAGILWCPVSLTATTTDGLGFLGNSEWNKVSTTEFIGHMINAL